MSETPETKKIEQQVLEAVTKHAYGRYEDLTISNVMGWSEEEKDRMAMRDDGSLVYVIYDVHITETEPDEDVGTIYYVAATIEFQVDDGGEPLTGCTDIYECYKSGDDWLVQWHGE